MSRELEGLADLSASALRSVGGDLRSAVLGCEAFLVRRETTGDLRVKGIGWLRAPPLRTSSLPPRVIEFQRAARILACRHDDRLAVASSLPIRELSTLLSESRDAKHIVELGTAVGWTAGSLVLGLPEAEVLTVDPYLWPGRARYLSLLSLDARRRLQVVQCFAEEGPTPHQTRDVDVLFIDTAYDEDVTRRAYAAWISLVRQGGCVIFDDYVDPHWTAVARVCETLGLVGNVVGRMLIVRHEGPEPKERAHPDRRRRAEPSLHGW